jgi:hypothetical protein
MSAIDDGAIAPLRLTESRLLGCGGGLALAASAAFLFHRVAPGAPATIPAGLAALCGLAALALAFTLDDAALPRLTTAVAAGVGLLVFSTLVEQEARLRLMSVASAAFGVGLAVWLARTARKRPSVSLSEAALFALTLACLAAYAAYLVLVCASKLPTSIISI